MDQKKYFQKKLSIILSILIIGPFYIFYAQAQLLTNWTPLAPYNTLWPLWSPSLSPLDAYGIAQPIVSYLTPYTILPVQPGLTWNPSLTYPWLLYNTPSGLAYYDPLYGIDLWPPDYLVSSLGLPTSLPGNFPPLPLTIDPTQLTLPPTDPTLLSIIVPWGNNLFTTFFPQTSPVLGSSTIIGF